MYVGIARSGQPQSFSVRDQNSSFPVGVGQPLRMSPSTFTPTLRRPSSSGSILVPPGALGLGGIGARLYTRPISSTLTSSSSSSETNSS